MEKSAELGKLSERAPPSWRSPRSLESCLRERPAAGWPRAQTADRSVPWRSLADQYRSGYSCPPFGYLQTLGRDVQNGAVMFALRDSPSNSTWRSIGCTENDDVQSMFCRKTDRCSVSSRCDVSSRSSPNLSCFSVPFYSVAMSYITAP